MARSLSRGRFDRSPLLDASPDSYREPLTSRSMKKASYTPRGGMIPSSSRDGGGLYATPPRSPLGIAGGGGHRSASRPRFGRDRDSPYESDYDDRRNPANEERYGRSASSARERIDDAVDDDSLAHGSAAGSRAREVLSKLRGGSRAGTTDRGLYSEPPSKPPLRRGLGPAASSPRRRLDLDDLRDDVYPDGYGDASLPTSRYEVIGMKEELKKKEEVVASLRRELDDVASRYDEDVQSIRSKLVATFKEDMREMKEDIRSKLVATFKEDMREMKEEWEDAFRRLKDEGDASQRAMEAELDGAARAKAEAEAELNEARAKHRTRAEEAERAARDRLEELKRSKEEDLERLRAMYEEHLEGTRKASQDVETELRAEVHTLLEENEKIKNCYDNLESEARRIQSDLDEADANRERATDDAVRLEKEVQTAKDELADALDAAEKRGQRIHEVEDELSEVRGELERRTSEHQRVAAERDRFEREYDATSKELDELATRYDKLVKTYEKAREERALEGRYAEALAKQRDNLNAIVENGRAETEELKRLNTGLEEANRSYVGLGKEFRLKDGEVETLREALSRGERLGRVCEEFDVADGTALRETLAKAEKAGARLEALGRERERYNATVKALKVDLKALHGGDAGPETSLQEHMRLLNERWDANEVRLRQTDKLKGELEESIQLLEEHATEREKMIREHGTKVDGLERDLREAQAALVKVEREKSSLSERASDLERLDAKTKRAREELDAQVAELRDRLDRAEDERRERDAEAKSLNADRRALQAELDKVRSKKSELEDALGKMDEVKGGMKKKLETAYYDLEEARRELSSYEAELSTLSKKRSEERELREALERERRERDDVLDHARREAAAAAEEAKAEASERFKVQLRLLEEKHADSDRRNGEYLEQKFRDEMDELRTRNRQLERTAKEHKESLDQKSMAEIKRRGEFAKQKQELEILRSKERHLETHVNQLEEHISKVVADYEARLQGSGATTCSSDEEKALKKQVRELEKKLEVSSAAMKQIGKSSLLMEKENERLKHDKNELKLKLKKLVDCAEKFQAPK
ncbi:hypothetical protein ACHAWF_008709 [Thalassiosira exigua]